MSCYVLRVSLPSTEGSWVEYLRAAIDCLSDIEQKIGTEPFTHIRYNKFHQDSLTFSYTCTYTTHIKYSNKMLSNALGLCIFHSTRSKWCPDGNKSAKNFANWYFLPKNLKNRVQRGEPFLAPFSRSPRLVSFNETWSSKQQNKPYLMQGWSANTAEQTQKDYMYFLMINRRTDAPANRWTGVCVRLM